MTSKIKTIDHGYVSIVNEKSRRFYSKMIDLIEDCNGIYYEIWQHESGYKAAILSE